MARIIYNVIFVSVFIIACSIYTLVGAVGRWKWFPRALKSCGDDKLIVEPTDVDVVYFDHGKQWYVRTVVVVKEDTNTAAFTVAMYRDVNPPVKLLSVRLTDMCNVIQKDNKFVNLIYATGEFPRTCQHKKGAYNVTRMDGQNMTGIMVGNFAQYRGTFNIKMHSFDDKDNLIMCMSGYGQFKIMYE